MPPTNPDFDAIARELLKADKEGSYWNTLSTTGRETLASMIAAALRSAVAKELRYWAEHYTGGRADWDYGVTGDLLNRAADLEKEPVLGASIGFCHRFPPLQNSEQRLIDQRFIPVVLPCDWCGEHSPREENKQ